MDTSSDKIWTPRQRTTHFFDCGTADDHEWGLPELSRLLTSPHIGSPEDELLIRITRNNASWLSPCPEWTRREQGWYELKTPCGVLTVRRMIGWTVERDGMPLVWSLYGQRVIFDKLERAMTAAWVHAEEEGPVGDDLRWHNRPGDLVAVKGPHLSGAAV
jgi:hypothetical protein